MKDFNISIENEILDDKEIIERVLKGEKSYFELLMRKYNTRLFRICKSFSIGETDAEDLMQSTYLNAYTHLADFNNNSLFSTWLTRILINECLMFKKKELKQQNTKFLDLNFNINEQNENPAKELMSKELQFALERAIISLPEKYKLVFVMREIEEMSTKETSEVLKMSESNVKIRLRRSKILLYSKLKGYNNFDEVFRFELNRCNRIANYVMSRI